MPSPSEHWGNYRILSCFHSPWGSPCQSANVFWAAERPQPWTSDSPAVLEKCWSCISTLFWFPRWISVMQSSLRTHGEGSPPVTSRQSVFSTLNSASLSCPAPPSPPCTAQGVVFLYKPSPGYYQFPSPTYVISLFLYSKVCCSSNHRYANPFTSPDIKSVSVTDTYLDIWYKHSRHTGIYLHVTYLITV